MQLFLMGMQQVARENGVVSSQYFESLNVDQINSYGVDPSAPLPDDDEESNGVMFAEPLCPLSANGLAAFMEEMSGVVGTDVWDISPYLHSLDVLRPLKQLYSSSTDIIGRSAS